MSTGGVRDLQGLQESGKLRVSVGDQRAIERDGMQRFGNQQVQIAVVQLERGEARVIVT